MAVQVSTQKKSGMKTLKPGEILFHEGDRAESMYIIQKGHVRLFRPKGKGYVELAVLKNGEMMGEMAYFDVGNRTRSASAAAITTVDIIEISFVALDKTMQTLNPWFKTLINTLADRLRQSNERVKELESNSVGYSSDYKFFQSADVVKMLSLFFLCFRSMGEKKENRWHLSTSKLKMYALDIFHIQEAKLEEFIRLLMDEKILEEVVSKEDETKVLVTREPETFRTFQVFFNAQRSMKDDKKLIITPKCEKFLQKVVEQIEGKELHDGKIEVDLSEIVSYFKTHNIPVALEDFQGAQKAKFAGEYKMDESEKITCILNADYFSKMYPVVRFMNALTRANDEKAKKN